MLRKIIFVTIFFLSCLLRSYCLAQTWIASFSTEWRLGLEEVEPQFFRWPMLLITDQQGYVYIHSYGDPYLRVFDAQGRFVKYIGRKGQGPGEFEAISQFFVDSENKLYISDPINGRITIYDHNRGRLLNSFHLLALPAVSQTNPPSDDCIETPIPSNTTETTEPTTQDTSANAPSHSSKNPQSH